jgi:hypothetical protein
VIEDRTYLDEQKNKVPFLDPHFLVVSRRNTLKLNQRSVYYRHQDKTQLQKSRRQDTLNNRLGDFGEVSEPGQPGDPLCKNGDVGQ